MSQKIRIKLKSYDHNLVDKSSEQIVKTVKATGAVISGPIPLPTHKRIFTVNRSTFVNKKSREQFQLSSYKRLIDIFNATAKTIDALINYIDCKDKNKLKYNKLRFIGNEIDAYKLIKKRNYDYLNLMNGINKDYRYIVSLPDIYLIREYNI